MKLEYLSPEEVAKRGEAIYADVIRSRASAEDVGKFVVIDVMTGQYEIDTDHAAAIGRMLTNHAAEGLYSIRIGYPTAYKLGGHNLSVTT